MSTRLVKGHAACGTQAMVGRADMAVLRMSGLNNDHLGWGARGTCGRCRLRRCLGLDLRGADNNGFVRKHDFQKTTRDRHRRELVDRAGSHTYGEHNTHYTRKNQQRVADAIPGLAPVGAGWVVVVAAAPAECPVAGVAAPFAFEPVR